MRTFSLKSLGYLLSCFVTVLGQNNAIEYFNNGNTKLHLKEYQGAIKDYNKAIELNPDSEGAYYNRGLAKQNLEDYNGAIEDFTKTIEINPIMWKHIVIVVMQKTI